MKMSGKWCDNNTKYELNDNKDNFLPEQKH